MRIFITTTHSKRPTGTTGASWAGRTTRSWTDTSPTSGQPEPNRISNVATGGRSFTTTVDFALWFGVIALGIPHKSPCRVSHYRTVATARLSPLRPFPALERD